MAQVKHQKTTVLAKNENKEGIAGEESMAVVLGAPPMLGLQKPLQDLDKPNREEH